MTDKQKAFADEYLIDLNATRAYKAVYKNIKDDKVAKAAASRLLANVNVSVYVEKRMKDREKRTEITQDRVLNELATIGFANLRDYLEYKTTKRVITYEDGEPIIDYAQVIEVVDSSKVDTTAVQEVSISKDGTFKFKLYDKQKALELIGRHLGMFNDKLEIKGKVDVSNPYANLSEEELKRIAKL